MPICLPENLPAFSTLSREGVDVIGERAARRQDIRPLKIALLNLMPKKIETETQFSRLIGATPLQIELTLVRMSEHKSKTADPSHMAEFYRPFEDIRSERFDGLIITGAPIEHLDYEEVSYWDELTEIFEWAKHHVHSTMGVCWAGMAALGHYHNIPKLSLKAKRFGCFRHQNKAPISPYLRGISDDFLVPVSRWTELARKDIAKAAGLEILIDSEAAGPCLIEDRENHFLANLNHFEYDSATLKGEYERDLAKDAGTSLPVNYFPDNNPQKPPQNRWKSTAHLLFGNWINEIYQTTPFEISRIGIERTPPLTGEGARETGTGQ